MIRLVRIRWTVRFEEFQAAAEHSEATFGKIEVQGAGDIDRAIREAAQNGLEAVIVGQSPMFFIERSRIAQLAIEHRLRSIGYNFPNLPQGFSRPMAPSLLRSSVRHLPMCGQDFERTKPHETPG